MSQTSAHPTVGIVTVTYNSAGVLDGFLRSILAQTYRHFVLYIVDNASVDVTLNKLFAYDDPRIIVIANADNRGVATGNNQGIEAACAAGCEYVLLINNDTEFETSLIEKLLMGLAEHQCEMIVPKIMYHNEPHIIWCAGGGFVKWRFYLPFHFGQNMLDQGQYDAPRSISYAPTCCMLIRSKVFDEVGFMDETFFVYFDDVDFCFRAMRKEIRMFYLPPVQFTHKVSTLTEGYNSPFGIKYHFRNRVYFLRKHFHPIIWLTWLAWFQLHLLFLLMTGKSNLRKFVAIQKSLSSGVQLSVKTII